MTSESTERQKVLKDSKRVVVKLGTAVLMRDEGGVALSRFYSFVEGIADLIKDGKEVLLVTSGAIGLGVKRLNLEKRPKELPLKQACAAVGQGLLMSMYADAFEKLGITTAQVLLTEDDFNNRKRYLNLRSTIAELISLKVLPIINENDTVSTVELEAIAANQQRKVNFGDNDKLSALVASKMDADILMILTDVEGLYTADPKTNADAVLVPLVRDMSDLIADESQAKDGEVDGNDDSAVSTADKNEAKKRSFPSSNAKTAAATAGRGGIKTKLEAARVATQAGCACIIAGGKQQNAISRVFGGEELGTLFLPNRTMGGKLRWIAYATTVNASIGVNDGAMDALLKRKASLLGAGVTDVNGVFKRGDVVSIVDPSGREFARGIVNYNSDETRLLSGKKSDEIDLVVANRNYDAIVTRDNLAILAKE
ncbi:MAG: glutamate 5-kinase [Candidatus Melainabacteria bacterium]|nr:glutamate 5-kinase [Candidatus Melainabacteria bacterium]